MPFARVVCVEKAVDDVLCSIHQTRLTNNHAYKLTPFSASQASIRCFSSTSGERVNEG
jgi:hypothetical protein